MDDLDPNTELGTQLPDELTSLKSRADMMGLRYHPSIGLETLREKIARALAGEPELPEEPEGAAVVAAALAPVAEQPLYAAPVVAPAPKISPRAQAQMDAARLIRVVVSCMNPLKKEWEGEIFTVSNSLVGTYKKFVPFNIDEGFHIPHIIYEQLKERMFQTFVTEKGPRGERIKRGKQVKEFAIQLLDPLTADELKDLAQRQAMAAGN